MTGRINLIENPAGESRNIRFCRRYNIVGFFFSLCTLYLDLCVSFRLNGRRFLYLDLCITERDMSFFVLQISLSLSSVVSFIWWSRAELDWRPWSYHLWCHYTHIHTDRYTNTHASFSFLRRLFCNRARRLGQWRKDLEKKKEVGPVWQSTVIPSCNKKSSSTLLPPCAAI